MPRPRDADEFQERRRDVGKHPVVQRPAGRRASDEDHRHRIERVRGDRVALASRFSSALPWSAVMQSSEPGRRQRTPRARDDAEALSTISSASIVASQTPVWPTMSAFA